MAVKPTTDDLIGWRKLQTAPDDATLAVLTEAFETALDDVESRIDLPVGTTDDVYPQRVRTAIILTANRLAKRGAAPSGVEGFGGDGVVVRLSALDADVEHLIHRYLKVDGFR